MADLQDLARELAGQFPDGAIVQNGPSVMDDPPTHHVAGLFPVSTGGVVFWDSDVDGLQTVTPPVKSLTTVQEEPVRVVRVDLGEGRFLLVSAHVPESRLARNAQFREEQAQMAGHM